MLVANAVGIFKGNKDDEIEQIEEIRVVNVVGMNADLAKATLEELSLKVETTYEESDDIEENQVMEQSIKEGEMVEAGTTITITVSSGKGGVDVPDVTGKTEEDASAQLRAEGFKVSVDTDYNDDVEEGYVISQSPEGGEKAAEGANIQLIISMGPAVKKTEAFRCKPESGNGQRGVS